MFLWAEEKKQRMNRMNYTEATNYIEEVPKFTKKNKPENRKQKNQ